MLTFGDGFSEETEVALVAALKENATITTLEIGGLGLGDEAAAVLAEVLETTATLRVLAVYGSGFSEAHCEALKASTTLTALTLEDWRAEEVQDALAEALQTSVTLISLTLDGPSDGAGEIAAGAQEAVARNRQHGAWEMALRRQVYHYLRPSFGG